MVVAFVGLTLLPALSLQASAAVAPQRTDPIRLPLTFIQSTPITTITVGGQAVRAIVDISGGDADGALTLSKEAIENVDGLSLGTAVANDAFGHEFTRPRFRVSGVIIGGRTFQNIRVVQALVHTAEDGPRFPMQLESTSSASILLLWTTRAHPSACGRLIRRTLRA